MIFAFVSIELIFRFGIIRHKRFIVSVISFIPTYIRNQLSVSGEVEIDDVPGSKMRNKSIDRIFDIAFGRLFIY